MISLINIYISSLVVICVTADTTDEFKPIDYETAKNLTADYCYARSFSEVPDIVKKCKYIVLVDFEVPGGETLQLHLQKRSVVLFEGTITFGVKYWKGTLIDITGDDIQIIGGTKHLLNGQGEHYWDGHGGAGGVDKPVRVISIHSNRGIFKNINIKNCPTAAVGMIGKDLILSGFNINNDDGFKGGLAKHTDALTFAHSDNILIEDSKITNQDDCVNVLHSNNSVIRNVHCWGSHGLSFSAISEKNDNVIHNITFEDCSIGGSLNGIHILVTANAGGGLISQITYRNIEIKDVTSRGIEFRQDFLNNDHPGNKVIIDGLTLENVHGTVSKKAWGVYIVCGEGSCRNWNWSNVKLTGSKIKDHCVNFKPNGYSC